MKVAGDQPAAATEFAALLKRFRADAGLSQGTLADQARVSVQAVSALERGYRRAPYRKTLDRLADALGLTGEPRALFEAAAARARTGRTEDDAFVTRAHNLPRRLTSFLGRDEMVREVSSLVADSPLVTVAGTGGAGKTRAAIEVGTHVLSRYASGVWFVELSGTNESTLVANAVATVLGVQESSQRPLLDSLIAYLEEKQLLLVLDNCEHVLAGVRQVALGILSACAKVSILATSREALGVPGERVYRIPPLAFPPEQSPTSSEALKFGAVALFADRALAADGRFSITDDNAPAVAEICRRLDGLPLAIELAAARVTVLSPRQLAERLDRVFEVLAGSERLGLPRQRTMRTVIDWSYGLLASHARLLFDRLAIFAGGFTFDTAAAICADETIARSDVLDLLASLVDKSLVGTDFRHGDARYVLLELTRQYARERLDERIERDALARRHARVYLELAERLDQEWYTAPERIWFARAEPELDNWRAALEWSLVGRHDIALGQALASALARIWYSLSAAEGLRWVTIALATIDDHTPRAVAAQLALAQAELLGALAQYKASLAAAEHTLEILASFDDPLATARAKQTAGSALGALGQAEEGEALLQEALTTARALGNHRLRATALGELGTARSRKGDVAGARAFYAEALAIYTSRDLDRPAASIAGHLAEVEFAAGDAAAALQRAEEALAAHEAANNRRSVANDLSNMAAYLIALDDFDDAAIHAAQGLSVSRDVRSRVLTACALQHLAAIAALRPRDGATNAQRDRERAAKILGFVDARMTALEFQREYTERQEYDRTMQVLRETIGEAAIADAMVFGREWTEDRAVAEALAGIAEEE